ncbi:MAG: hypothetical protein ACFFB0_01685 [Promethearchaeota archaeon]
MKKVKPYIKLKREAKESGMMNLPLTEVYFSKQERNSQVNPDVHYKVRKFLKRIITDKTLRQEASLLQNHQRFNNYMIPSLRLYIEIDDIPIKIWGFAKTPHAFHMKIYCDNKDTMREIAKIAFALFKKGDLIEKTDWDAVESIFNVNHEECISIWKAILN